MSQCLMFPTNEELLYHNQQSLSRWSPTRSHSVDRSLVESFVLVSATDFITSGVCEMCGLLR